MENSNKIENMLSSLKRKLGLPIYRCPFCKKWMVAQYSIPDTNAHDCYGCSVIYWEAKADYSLYKKEYFIFIGDIKYSVSYHPNFSYYEYCGINKSYLICKCGNIMDGIFIPYFSLEGLTKEKFQNKIKTYILMS